MHAYIAFPVGCRRQNTKHPQKYTIRTVASFLPLSFVRNIRKPWENTTETHTQVSSFDFDLLEKGSCLSPKQKRKTLVLRSVDSSVPNCHEYSFAVRDIRCNKQFKFSLKFRENRSNLRCKTGPTLIGMELVFGRRRRKVCREGLL